jgi:hypothetical protein
MGILLKRNCPKCNNEVFYTNKNSFYRAKRENRLCYNCSYPIRNFSNKGKKLSEEERKKISILTKLAMENPDIREKISIGVKNAYKNDPSIIERTRQKNVGRCPSNKGKLSFKIKRLIDSGDIWEKNSVWYRKCPSCRIPTKCSTYDNAYRRINVVCHKCGISKNVGRKCSTETRNKQKIAAIKRLKKYPLYNRPNFNPNACEFIDQLNILFGFNLQHALNGGEVWINGFYPDGYDKEKNVVFEYDEKWHKNPKTLIEDGNRQKEIINQLHPTLFLRYDEKNCRLYDCQSQSTIPISL